VTFMQPRRRALWGLVWSPNALGRLGALAVGFRLGPPAVLPAHMEREDSKSKGAARVLPRAQ